MKELEGLTFAARCQDAIRTLTDNLLRLGISTRQGAHPMNQKFSTTTLPRRDLDSKASPSSEVTLKAGGGVASVSTDRVPSSDCAIPSSLLSFRIQLFSELSAESIGSKA